MAKNAGAWNIGVISFSGRGQDDIDSLNDNWWQRLTNVIVISATTPVRINNNITVFIVAFVIRGRQRAGTRYALPEHPRPHIIGLQ